MPYAVNGFGECTAIGVEQAGELVAGIVYHDWRPAYRSMQLSIAGIGRDWCSKRFLRCIFTYPFIQMECNRITVMIAANNYKSIDFVTRLGLQLEGVVRQGFGNVDCLIYGFLRNEAVKWL